MQGVDRVPNYREWREDVLAIATDRFERRLTEECSALRLDLRAEMANGFSALRKEIAETKVDLIKWSFVFWIGQLVALTGVISFMLSGR